jgi:hypothetical protein
MREKLIELLMNSDILCDTCGESSSSYCAEAIADHLIANGVTVQRWIPVTERLPGKMGQYVYRYVFGENMDYPFYQVLWYFANLEKPHFQHEGSMGLTVTHWMPLPEPPKGE